MAEKKDRGNREKEIRVDRVDATLPPPVSEGFSLRTQIRLFFVALLIVVGFLYGLYQPFLRYYLAADSMDRAEAWMARARSVKSDTVASYPVYDHIEDEISALMPFNDVVQEYLLAFADVRNIPGNEDGRASARRARLETAVLQLKSAQGGALARYVALIDTTLSAMERDKIVAAFPEIVTELKKRRAQLLEFDAYTKNLVRYDEIPVRDEYYTFHPIRTSQVLILFRKSRDLFDERAAYDQALRELTIARGYGRTWTPARKMLADFYHERGFYPFGLDEDLVVMRIDGGGADGKASFERIRRSVAEKRPEAPYRLGIAHLAREEYDEAERAFRVFVATDPGSPFVVKAWELIEACARKDHAALDAFVEDEIWI